MRTPTVEFDSLAISELEVFAPFCAGRHVYRGLQRSQTLYSYNNNEYSVQDLVWLIGRQQGLVCERGQVGLRRSQCRPFDCAIPSDQTQPKGR